MGGPGLYHIYETGSSFFQIRRPDLSALNFSKARIGDFSEVEKFLEVLNGIVFPQLIHRRRSVRSGQSTPVTHEPSPRFVMPPARPQ
jgi:hypothetical protein